MLDEINELFRIYGIRLIGMFCIYEMSELDQINVIIFCVMKCVELSA